MKKTLLIILITALISIISAMSLETNNCEKVLTIENNTNIFCLKNNKLYTCNQIINNSCILNEIELQDQFEKNIAYDKSSKLIKDKKNLIAYPSQKFIKENDLWKDIRKAKSLKETNYKCSIDFDGKFIAECVDYNYTSKNIRINLSLLDNNELRKLDLKNLIKIYSNTTSTTPKEILNLINYTIENKIITINIPSGIEEIIHIGYNSTKIKINTSYGLDRGLSSNGTWVKARAGTGSLALSTLHYARSNNGSGNYYIGRLYYTFNTSSIPDTASVKAVVLNYPHIFSSNQDNDGTDYIAPTKSNHSTTITTADWTRCQDSIIGDKLDITSLNTPTYVKWNFNGTGLNHINKTGLTKICLREGHDIQNTAINTGSDSSRTYFSDYGGSYRSTYLNITYVDVLVLNITTPLTSLPTNVTYPENTSIRIRFTEGGTNVTSLLYDANVSIGGTNSSIITYFQCKGTSKCSLISTESTCEACTICGTWRNQSTSWVPFLDDLDYATSDLANNWIEGSWTTVSGDTTNCVNDDDDDCARIGNSVNGYMETTNKYDLSQCKSGTAYFSLRLMDILTDSGEDFFMIINSSGLLKTIEQHSGGDYDGEYMMNISIPNYTFSSSVSLRVGSTGLDASEYYYVDNIKLSCVNKSLCSGSGTCPSCTSAQCSSCSTANCTSSTRDLTNKGGGTWEINLSVPSLSSGLKNLSVTGIYEYSTSDSDIEPYCINYISLALNCTCTGTTNCVKLCSQNCRFNQTNMHKKNLTIQGGSGNAYALRNITNFTEIKTYCSNTYN